jgi:hypothetical protein
MLKACSRRPIQSNHAQYTKPFLAHLERSETNQGWRCSGTLIREAPRGKSHDTQPPDIVLTFGSGNHF